MAHCWSSDEEEPFDRPETILLVGSRPATTYAAEDGVNFDLLRIDFANLSISQSENIQRGQHEMNLATRASEDIARAVLMAYFCNKNGEEEALQFKPVPTTYARRHEESFDDGDPTVLMDQISNLLAQQSSLGPNDVDLVTDMLRPLENFTQWPLEAIARLILVLFKVNARVLKSQKRLAELDEHLEDWFSTRAQDAFRDLKQHCGKPLMQDVPHPDSTLKKAIYLLATLDIKTGLSIASSIINRLGPFRMAISALAAIPLRKVGMSLEEFFEQDRFTGSTVPPQPVLASLKDHLAADFPLPPRSDLQTKPVTQDQSTTSFKSTSPAAGAPVDSPSSQAPSFPTLIPARAMDAGEIADLDIFTGGPAFSNISPRRPGEAPSNVAPSASWHSTHPAPPAQSTGLFGQPAHLPFPAPHTDLSIPSFAPSASTFRATSSFKSSLSAPVTLTEGTSSGMTKTAYEPKFVKLGAKASHTFKLWDHQGPWFLINPQALKTTEIPSVGDVFVWKNVKDPLKPETSVWTFRGSQGWIDITDPFLDNAGPSHPDLFHPNYTGKNAKVLTWKTFASKEPQYVAISYFPEKQTRLMAEAGASSIRVKKEDRDVNMYA